MMRLAALILAATLCVQPAGTPVAADDGQHWVGTWATAPQLVEPDNLPPAPGFRDATLRQIVRVSLGGKTVRVRFSNAFGTSALTLVWARIARSAGEGRTALTTDRPLTFGGRASVTIPAGALAISDALAFDLPPLSDVSITIYLRGAPAGITGHPGSRTTSFLQRGEASSDDGFGAAARVEHWYFLSGIDVLAGADASAIVVLGDSITDGRGSTTDQHDRWPDNLARRLQSAPRGSTVAVLNQGIGGNRLLRDGLGPNALARVDRDVLAQAGVRWLVVLEGINDIGTGPSLRAKGEAAPSAEDVIFAYEQIIERAHAHGLLVYGATIMPYEGFTYMNYYTPEGEADRQRVNAWIRTSGRFDGVIDFDAAARDPERPSRLSAAVDGGDHLHPSANGYRIMADAIDLGLFAVKPGR
jgi:lysophospholipase L1-like esterase